MPNMKRWSAAKLDKELAFAEMAVDPSHEETRTWLDAIRAEISRRAALSS